jgi:hypothetical protein
MTAPTLPPPTMAFGDDAPICPHCRESMYDLVLRLDAIETLEFEGCVWLTANADCDVCAKPVRLERTVDGEDCTAITRTSARRTARDICYLENTTSAGPSPQPRASVAAARAPETRAGCKGEGAP